MNGRSHKAVLLTWAVVYPTITALAAALEPFMASWPLALRTFVLSALMVPLVSYVALPLIQVCFAKRLG